MARASPINVSLNMSAAHRKSQAPWSRDRLGRGLLFAPLAWFAGFHLFWFHLVALEALRQFPKWARFLRTPTVVTLAGILLTAWVSLMMAAGGASWSRLASAFYASTYWIMAAIVFCVASVSDWRSARRCIVWFAVAFALVAGAIALFGIYRWFTQGPGAVAMPTLLGLLVGGRALEIPFVYENLVLPLLTVDLIGGQPAPRTTALAPYPTVTAALVLFTAPTLILFGRSAGRLPIWTIGVALGGMCLALYLANSRATVLAAALAVPFVILIHRRSFLVTAAVALPVIAILSPFILDLLDGLLATRATSTATRFQLYRLQVEAVLSSAPVFGFGVKDRIAGLDVPVGSQSAIFGALYRNGVVGLVLLLALMAIVTMRWLASMRIRLPTAHRRFLAAIGVPLIGMNVILFTEDLDWPQLLCYLYFYYQGLINAVVRDGRREIAANGGTATQSADSPDGRSARSGVLQ